MSQHFVKELFVAIKIVLRYGTTSVVFKIRQQLDTGIAPSDGEQTLKHGIATGRGSCD